MIKVTVASIETRENSGIGKLTGKPYHMIMQNAYAHTFGKDGKPNPYPEKIELILDVDSQSKMPRVYPVGEYQLHPASLYVGKYGLEVAPKLVALKA